MHGRGCAWQIDMNGRGHVWQEACMAGVCTRHIIIISFASVCNSKCLCVELRGVMAHSHCTGPGRGMGPGNRKMGVEPNGPRSGSLSLCSVKST